MVLKEKPNLYNLPRKKMANYHVTLLIVGTFRKKKPREKKGWNYILYNKNS